MLTRHGITAEYAILTGNFYHNRSGKKKGGLGLVGLGFPVVFVLCLFFPFLPLLTGSFPPIMSESESEGSPTRMASPSQPAHSNSAQGARARASRVAEALRKRRNHSSSIPPLHSDTPPSSSSAHSSHHGQKQGQGPKIPSFSGREDFYETLQLNHATTPLTSYSARDIAAAYRRVAVKVHPDKISADASLDERTKSLALFHKATEAYRILSDETLRQAYDAARSEREQEGNDATATTTTTTGDTGRSTRSSDQTLVSKTTTTSDYSSFQSFMCEQFGDDYAQRLRTYENTLEEARAKAASLLESADPEERRAQLANLKAEQARKARLRRIAAEQTRDNAAWEMRAHVVRAREEKEARERANEVRRKQFIEEAFFADAKSRADARAEEQRRAKQREENSKRAQTVAAAVAAASASVDA